VAQDSVESSVQLANSGDNPTSADPPSAAPTGRILVVDDSALMRAMLVRLLRQVGQTDVLTADSGASAFATLGFDDDSNPAAIDLILMDLVLPDTDGIAAIRALASRKRLRNIPVIMVTAMQEVEVLRGAFEAGATDYLTKPLNEVELLARVGAALRLKREIDRREAHERELVAMSQALATANAQLEQLSRTDPLTGLANRRSFDQVLASEWARGLRQRTPLTLLLLDVDHFKRFNDTYGHQEGDRCLIAVAGVLREAASRASDLAARYGGEEFVILLPDTDAEGGRAVGERALATLATLAIPHRASSVGPFVSASIGIASCIPEARTSAKALVEAADRALYRAKETGRARVMVDGTA
jgi:diguanylate cyclase (GGDEF)-like protein